MGFLTFVGMIICFGAVFGGVLILGGKMDDFIDVPSIVLVIVPTIGALVTTYPISLLAKFPAHMKVLLGKGYQLEDYITRIVDLARKARTEGLLALENEQLNEPFMEYALRMLVDGLDEDAIRNSLEANLTAIGTRHTEATSLYEKAAAFAPAFGMCATVVGLVNMLMGLDFGDPDAINKLGGNMAMALITTFYGALLANAIFTPIATRLKVLHKREIFCKTVIGDSILAIQRGENPSLISDSLTQQLPMKARKKFAGGGGASGDR